MMTFTQVTELRMSLHHTSNAAQRVTIAVESVVHLLPPEVAERVMLALRSANKLLEESKAMAAAAFAGDTAETILPCVVSDEAIERVLGETGT